MIDLGGHVLLIIFIVIAFVIALYCVRWRFTMMMSKENLSLFSPGLMSDDPSFQTPHLTNKRIVIATMLRDTGDRIDSIKKRVTALADRCRECRIVIVENDSTDDTRPKLLDWATKDKRVAVLGCGVNAPVCKLDLAKTERSTVARKRIEKMVTLRNIYMEYIEKHYASYDHLIVWDLDIVGAVYLDAIDRAVSRFKDDSLQAVCARGVYEYGPVPVYYDTYAHATDDDLNTDDGVKLLSHIRLQAIGITSPHGDEPFRVQTCFSGFTIYRMSEVYRLRYKLSRASEKLRCEHATLHDSLHDIRLDPSLKHLVLANL